MTLKTLSVAAATALDQELMSTCAFSLDQLMELAGLAVSQAVYRVHPPERGPRVLVACGPGNNGGDGLVAARHLRHYGYRPTVLYPKPSGQDLLQRLTQQLRDLHVPILGGATDDDLKPAFAEADHVVDAVFGFSFRSSPEKPIREPFPAVIRALEACTVSVTAVDVPSSWDVEGRGPPPLGQLGHKYVPQTLVSLTAPKPLACFFPGRHFIGGRFVSPAIAAKYDFDVPAYPGLAQVVEVDDQGNVIPE